ncbi:MAG: hypothetical protein FD167_1012 [bacterium]|nr:MAG: hypothetical protein FD167_1012 [bacterium]
MEHQDITQKICPYCGGILAPNEINCAECLIQISSNSTSGRILLAFGLFFILLSFGILAGTFWYVENKRLTTTTHTNPFIPINSTTNNASSSNIDLSKLSSQELLNMVPVKVLSRYRTSLGDNLPDQVSVINQDNEQYLVLLGSERINTGDDDIKRFLASIFKLEGGALSDVSKEILPAELEKAGNITGQFINKGPDFDIKLPITVELFESCPNSDCEQAYYIQEVTWCGTDYQLGVKNWSNDPYTVLYVFAQALDQRSLPIRDRDFVATALDPLISSGFDREANQKWQVTNLTTNNLFELKSLDKVSYALNNSIVTITVNLEKQKNGIWQATSLENTDFPANTEPSSNNSP